MSSIPTDEKLRAAQLTLNRVSLDVPTESSSNEVDPLRHVRVMVYDIIRPGIKGKREPLMRLIDSKLLDIRSNSTISLDVHPALERWLEDKSQNHGLLLKVKFYSTLFDANHKLCEKILRKIKSIYIT